MQRTEKNRWIALTGISVAGFLGCIDFTIVNTALPTIQATLNATITQLQWVINIFMLALAAFMVMMGRTADLYGRRLVFYSGLGLFALASLGAGFSYDIQSLIFFRFLQGIAVAVLYTVPIAMIPTLFPTSQRGQATGILIGVNGLGLAIGPVIGGFILSALSWRWIFWINLPIILISLMFCLTSLTESKSPELNRRIDWLGFLLLLIAFPSLIFATVQGNNWGWLSLPIMGLYLLALICLILFYYVEYHSTAPIIQFDLFSNRTFLIAVLANFSLAFFYTLAFFLMPLYLHNIQNLIGYKIGLTLLPATLMVALFSPFVGRVVDKRGPRQVLLLGFSLFALSALLQTQFSVGTPLWFIIISFILFGIGWACILSPSIVAALASMPENVAGVAMGGIGTLHNFGGALGLALGTVVYHQSAKTILSADVLQYQIKPGTWIDQAIADPDKATSIIQQNLNLITPVANNLFQRFFIHGFNSAMWLLVVVSILVAIAIGVGLKDRTKS